MPAVAFIHRSRCPAVNVVALGRESQFFVSFLVLMRLLTRPTHRPRHAASGVFTWSKPVRPHPIRREYNPPIHLAGQVEVKHGIAIRLTKTKTNVTYNLK